MNLLKIENLKIKIANKTILEDFRIELKEGEILVLEGENGAGKSTLAKAICGNKAVEILRGKIEFWNKNQEKIDLKELEIHERSLQGIFMSFQKPVEIDGLNFASFIKAGINSHKKFWKEKELRSGEILRLIKQKASDLKISEEIYKSNLNSNLSGGQQKQSELLQIAIFEPRLIILDEIDSGLDLKNQEKVIQTIQKIQESNPETGFIIISHNPSFIKKLNPSQKIKLEKK